MVAVVGRAGDLGLTIAPIALESGFAWVPVPDYEIDRLAETTALPSSPRDERFVHFGSVVPAILAERPAFHRTGKLRDVLQDIEAAVAGRRETER